MQQLGTIQNRHNTNKYNLKYKLTKTREAVDSTWTLVLPTSRQKLPHFKLKRYMKFSAVFQKFYLSHNSSQSSSLQNPGGKH
jgi:hypothetical protein